MADGAFKIGLNEVQVGLCPGPVIYAVLRRLVGPRHADQLISSGLLLTPAQALEIGLVDRIVAEGEVVPAAVAWAQSMAALPPKAVAATRRFARQDLIALLDGLGPDDYRMMVDAWFSDETQRTMHALVERLKKRG
jgi:enoyl-CoA hydratase/carnithine racemase